MVKIFLLFFLENFLLNFLENSSSGRQHLRPIESVKKDQKKNLSTFCRYKEPFEEWYLRSCSENNVEGLIDGLEWMCSVLKKK